MCGEKFALPVNAILKPGSPPRVRGKVRITSTGVPPVGITPACAGKSRWSRGPGGSGSDHPRVCGEKLEGFKETARQLGSPPRMRGKGRRVYEATHGAGITPACAGKSKTSAVGCPGCRDHPRVCGEKSAGANVIGLSLGSPPRVRGKAAEPRASHGPQGITPAHAGKSQPVRP